MSQASSNKKLILVIGGTGVQGSKPSANGEGSPYAIRVLTRNPEGRRALELKAKGVELVKGTVDDFSSVLNALEGVYGVYVNTDSTTLGEKRETFIGIRIFELAKQVKTVRHYVWSNLEYNTKISGYNPEYAAEHLDGKGRVGDFLFQQASEPTETSMSWTQLTTGPYMDMLFHPFIGPMNKRADGTYVFTSPIGDGHMPMVSLRDIAYFARYIFDHRVETSGKDLRIASDDVTWDYLVRTFTKVTGKPAVYLRQSIDEWWTNWDGADRPYAAMDAHEKVTPNTNTLRKNFTKWWAIYRDNLSQRDFKWIRSVNPEAHTVESWMRENNYTGDLNVRSLLKLEEDTGFVTPNFESVSRL
ncbi:NAD(P)-binding protein [Panus rudis PR-1116 ss-1]|nr:NAD(P)-binding protein [Panus rudis PR-1116 ss-1]